MTYALVIEDSPEVAANLCRMLQEIGVESHAALSVREAFFRLLDHRPDIVFLDIMMPGFDGFEVLSYLNREPGYRSLPVCIVSSEDSDEIIQKARRAGVIGYIVKPASIEEFEKVLQKAKLI